MSGPAETRSDDVDAQLRAGLDALGDEIARTRRISARLAGRHVEGLTAAPPAKVWRWSRRGLLFELDEL